MLRVTTLWTAGNGGPYYTNMYFGGEEQAEAETAADATGLFFSTIGDRIAATTDGTVLPEVDIVSEATGQTTGTLITTPTAILTTGTGAFLPFATQGLVRVRTGEFINGRELRGRIFLPSVTDANMTGGKPSASYITDVNDAAAALIAATQFGVYSRVHNTFRNANSASMWSDFAVLRSRRD